ncbi:MAG: glycine cleavage system aminomethyltransferase GcvT, partial [Aestuariivirgaceae bacterium]
MAESAPLSGSLQRTALYDAHMKQGARMVPFAGYEMPVQFATGIIAEHNHTRTSAGLFDVSHMGQAFIHGGDHESAARALERQVPADILGLEPGRTRYTQFTNPQGGIIDDLMITRSPAPADDGKLLLVVNASRKAADYELLNENLPPGVSLVRIEDRSLLALQGPKAESVLSRHCPEAAAMPFMSAAVAQFDRLEINLSRSGYTGEDGYELSVPTRYVAAVYQALLNDPDVKPVGLGARDSLRLEAGLCLYGHDIDETTSPVEADLVWSIGRHRRTEGGYPGAERIIRELKEGPHRRRVGIRPEGRAPAREGTAITAAGRTVGTITSGSFGPTVSGPVAMGYV